MISNLLYAFGKQVEVKSCVKGQIPKRDCKCELVLSMFGEVGLKNTFLFQEPECHPVPELMISRQKIGLLVVVFTALHGMQTRSSDENSVRPSVCDKTKESVPAFLHRMKDDLP